MSDAHIASALTPPTLHLRMVDTSATCVETLTVDERDRALRIRDAGARAEFVARRSLVREVLAELSGQEPREIALDHRACASCGGPHGRPYAHGVAQYYSVTSTPHWAAMAVAERPVGVDLEEIAGLDVVHDVAPQLHPHERDAVKNALERSAEDACRVFTEIWTRKEALLKATGEGITVPLDRDDVSDVEARPVTGWHLAMMPSPPPGAVGAWALATA